MQWDCSQVWLVYKCKKNFPDTTVTKELVAFFLLLILLLLLGNKHCFYSLFFRQQREYTSDSLGGASCVYHYIHCTGDSSFKNW